MGNLVLTEDGSVLDDRGKVIFFSFARFMSDIVKGDCCFIALFAVPILKTKHSTTNTFSPIGSCDVTTYAIGQSHFPTAVIFATGDSQFLAVRTATV